jgi:CRP-like cAMP-binding protein
MNSEDLKQISVLREIDDEVRARLAATLEEREYAEGQTIFAEGDPGDSMYFIVRGRIRIEKRARTVGALTKTLTVLQDGDYFGEMSLFDHKPRSASAVAAETARVLRLSQATFDEIQQKSSVVVLAVLFGMLRTSSDRIRRLSTQLVVYDEVGRAIGEAPDLQTLLEVILQQLFSATSADWGLLLLRSQFSDRLEVRGEANLHLSPGQRESVSRGEGALALLLQDPQPRLIGAFGAAEPFKSCVRLGFETPSLLVAPIPLESQLLGLILLGGNEPNQFNLDALNLSRGVARQAAQAIMNARHREEEQARSRHAHRYVKF